MPRKSGARALITKSKRTRQRLGRDKQSKFDRAKAQRRDA